MRDSRNSLLIWLLLGALTLSTALNCYLITTQESVSWQSLLTDDDDDDDEEDAPAVPSIAEELRLTRAMLVRCQAEHRRKDSLLLGRVEMPVGQPVRTGL